MKIWIVYREKESVTEGVITLSLEHALATKKYKEMTYPVLAPYKIGEFSRTEDSSYDAHNKRGKTE